MFRSLRISHVEFRFPGSEKLGPSRNSRMERNFPVIPIFRNFRPTSRGTPKISERISGKCLFHSLHNPEFPEFLVEWKAPQVAPREMLGNQASDLACPDENLVARNVFYNFSLVIGFDQTNSTPISMPLFSQLLKCCK